MKIASFSFHVLMLLFLSLVASGQSRGVHTYHTARPALFYENKGQVIDQNRQPRKDVLALFSAPGFNMALTPQGMSYDLITTQIFKKYAPKALSKTNQMDAGTHEPGFGHDNDSILRSSYRVDVQFVNSNPAPLVVREGRSSYYENYFTEYTGQAGATDIHGYTKTTLLNVWPHIDIQFIADGRDDKSVEYNFILHPGANLADIQLRYASGTLQRASDNSLKIETPGGNAIESIPAVYYENDGERIEDKKPFVSYAMKDGFVTFTGTNIDLTNNTLVIDPKLVWGTYFGGDRGEGNYSIQADKDNNLYITGVTGSWSSIATKGAYQTTNSGEAEAYLAEFHSDGALGWSTYYGSDKLEVGTAVTIDVNGFILVGGLSGSTGGLATKGAWQQDNGGHYDAFIAKFTSAGFLLWGTYFGGDYDDGASNIVTDSKSNIYISGYTESKTHIATNGAWQEKQSGYKDAFLAKFSATGSLTWCTYYGGKKEELAPGLTIDSTGNIFLAGWTGSDSGIATSQSYQPKFGGGIRDGYIAKFSSSGALIWGTYYGGNSDDYVFKIGTDNSGDLSVAGMTYSAGMATKGAYQPKSGGERDAFIARFTSSDSLIWSTYYGGPSADEAYGIAVDDAKNIYISGYTRSKAGISTTGASQANYYGGNSDAFIAKFSPSGSLTWGTYYGGNRDETSESVAVDRLGFVYITGTTSSDSGISTSGSFKDTLSGNFEDAFLAKFDSFAINAIQTKTPYSHPAINIYPQPFTDIFNINYEIPQVSVVKITILSLEGKEMGILANLRQDAGSHTISYPAGDLPAGVYLLRFMVDNDISMHKLIKMK